MKKFNLILEIIFVILFTIALIGNLIAGVWLFVALDAACVILGIANIYLICRNLNKEKGRKSNERQDT